LAAQLFEASVLIIVTFFYYQVLGTDGSQISCLLQQFGKLTHSYDFLFRLQHKAIDRVLAEVKGWRAMWSVEKSSNLGAASQVGIILLFQLCFLSHLSYFLSAVLLNRN
jgi:hypothetical protein